MLYNAQSRAYKLAIIIFVTRVDIYQIATRLRVWKRMVYASVYVRGTGVHNTYMQRISLYVSSHKVYGL